MPLSRFPGTAFFGSAFLHAVVTGADDHGADDPGSHHVAMRFTGDRGTGRLLGVQLSGHNHAEIAKQADIAVGAICCGMAVDQVSDLHLSRSTARLLVGRRQGRGRHGTASYGRRPQRGR